MSKMQSDSITDSIALSICLHHGGPQGAKPKAEVIAQILADIKERKA
jgi:hypothetical protein